jgi:TrkA domain protein
MGQEIVSRMLPGIGMCHEISLHEGRRIGIVARRSGFRDFVVYDEDGDGAELSIELNDDESDAVAELLGAPKLVTRLATQQSQADEVLVEQLPMPHDSPFADRPLGHTKARTVTGASIVAVLRGGATHPSPGPEFPLHGGDLVVTVGTRDGLDRVARLLEDGG